MQKSGPPKAFETLNTHTKHYWRRTKVRNIMDKRIASTSFVRVPPPPPHFNVGDLCNHWFRAVSGQKFALLFTKHVVATLKMGGTGGKPYWKRVCLHVFPLHLYVLDCCELLSGTCLNKKNVRSLNNDNDYH